MECSPRGTFSWGPAVINNGIVESWSSFQIVTAGVYRLGFSVESRNLAEAGARVNGIPPAFGYPTLRLSEINTENVGYCENILQLNAGDSITITNTGGLPINSQQYWILIQQIA